MVSIRRQFGKDFLVFYRIFLSSTTFKINDGQIRSRTNKSRIIHPLIYFLFKPNAHKEWEVKKYIERHGCKQFVTDFNEKLSDWFHFEFHVVNCTWKLINYFIRPTSFKIEYVQVVSLKNDSWIIHKFTTKLVKCPANEVWKIRCYIGKYGCENFKKDFNEKLMFFFQSKTNVLTCIWKVIDHFIRPVSFKIEKCQVGTFTNDKLLIERLINELVTALRVWEVKQYIEKYGCEEFNDSFTKN